jgi:hypothetical protein
MHCINFLYTASWHLAGEHHAKIRWPGEAGNCDFELVPDPICGNQTRIQALNSMSNSGLSSLHCGLLAAPAVIELR